MTAHELKSVWKDLLHRSDGQRVLIRGDQAEVEEFRDSLLSLSTGAPATDAPVDARGCSLGEITDVLDACFYRRVNCIVLPYGCLTDGGASLALLLSGAPRESSLTAGLVVDLA